MVGEPQLSLLILSRVHTQELFCGIRTHARPPPGVVETPLKYTMTGEPDIPYGQAIGCRAPHLGR